LIVGNLYKLGAGGILRRCVLEQKIPMILEEAHDEIAGGHYGGREYAQNILCAGIWWPTLHKYAKEYCTSCDVCQRVGKPTRRDEIPLNPYITLQAFDKWAIDFVGPNKPQGKMLGERYIITAKKYLTRWEETTPITDCTIEIDAQFFF
jgi:hypothetical protein